ncbi:hypothetical protein [Deinococcus sp. Leaf326]|uniref:hypothetical protein n=1 Tax=Deinococcus sp. Leaf326 TaxID=1736338 RepID=UPI0006F76C53|nr:hypothetical protein [Deinococcus sp. Leaf326]KQR18874.1 hypothetical protein ASF71_19780 [Deinococcus sp. Leaf326]
MNPFLNALNTATAAELAAEIQVFSALDDDYRYEADAVFRGRQLALGIDRDQVKAVAYARMRALGLLAQAVKQRAA